MAIQINVVGKYDGRDLARAESALKNLGGQAADTGNKASAGMGKLSTASVAVGSAIGTFVGGLAVQAFSKLTGAIGDAFSNAATYQKLQDKLAQTLEVTGNKAQISVEGVKALAGSLESLSGVDENLIIENANVLATFKGIQNEGGKAGGTFDRTMAAALDLSVALGKDLNGTTLALGKALNDPIKGMTALSRVGVNFTKEQQAVIESMVKSGDKAGAQAYMLKALEGRFKGAAEAAGKGFEGSIARLNDSMGDFLRDAVTPLLDPLANLADAMVKDVMPAIKSFGDEVGSVLGDLFGGNLEGAADKVMVWNKKIVDKVGEVLPQITDKIGEIVIGIANFIVTQGPVIAEKVRAWAFSMYNWVLTEALPKVLEFLGGLIGNIATWISENAPTLGEKLGAWVGEFSGFVARAIPPLLANLGKFIFETLIPWVIARIPDLVKALVGMVKALAGFVIAAVPPLLANLAKMLLEIGKWIITEGVPKLVKAAIDLGAALVRGLWDGIVALAGWLADKVTGFFGGILDGVKDFFGIKSPSKVFAGVGNNLVTGLAKGITGNKKKVTKAMAEIQRAIRINEQYALTGRGSGPVSELLVNPDLIVQGNGMKKLLNQAREWGITITKTTDVATAQIDRAGMGAGGGGGSSRPSSATSPYSASGSSSSGAVMNVEKGAVVLNIYQGVDEDIARSIAVAINEQLWVLAREIRAS